MYSRVLPGNGIVAESLRAWRIYAVKAGHIATFAVLVNAGHNVKLHDIEVSDSGGFNPQRRKQGTGGLALEEGTSDFEIRHCRFGGLRGTGITLRAVERGNVIDNEFAVFGSRWYSRLGVKAVTIGSNKFDKTAFPRKR